MKLENRTNHKIITDAVKAAHKHLEFNSKMLNDIRDKDDFAYNSGSGEEIYKKIVNNDSVIFVYTYKPAWRWTKALGYSDGIGIHVNLLRLDTMRFEDLVGLLCHESMHQAGFGHGNNWKTREKCEKSVPYYVSEGISNSKWEIEND